MQIRFLELVLLVGCLPASALMAAESAVQGDHPLATSVSQGGQNTAASQEPLATVSAVRPLSANEGLFWPDQQPLPKPQVVRTAPGSHWEPHDEKRPHPVVVTPAPAEKPGAPPSDAVVLFDGTSLAQFKAAGKKAGASDAVPWKVENGYFEVVPKSGSIVSRASFGDCQLHIEWATPATVKGSGQGRGNSGIFLGGNGELQVLDSYENETYADGQAAALYGKYPPRVNAARRPGEWQTYDIIFEGPATEPFAAPREGTRLTVLHNGVLVHHAVDTGNRQKEISLLLQDHYNPVRYRNIWVRPLRPYPE